MADTAMGEGGTEQLHGSLPQLIYDGRYDYVGLWRFQAHCWLRVYVSDNAGDRPVVIATDLLDNTGTNITNFVEKLAWNVVHDPVVWRAAPAAAREAVTWIEHHPAEYDSDGTLTYQETFSIVTFTHDAAAEADANGLGTYHVIKEDPDIKDIIDILDFPIAPVDDGPHGTLGRPVWTFVSRERVEQMIGQPFPAVRGATDGKR